MMMDTASILKDKQLIPMTLLLSPLTFARGPHSAVIEVIRKKKKEKKIRQREAEQKGDQLKRKTIQMRRRLREGVSCPKANAFSLFSVYACA